MVRISSLLFLLFLIPGCDRAPVTIEIGQPEDEALALLETHADNISMGVGLLVSGGDAHWFELSDGTCVELWTQPDTDGVQRVVAIVLGEEGMGYIGKWEWGEQEKRDVDTLVLED
jgi:hypothetical protein